MVSSAPYIDMELKEEVFKKIVSIPFLKIT
jgi:hypothetical protein